MVEKLLSIIVPSYNSQDYMSHCLDSLLAIDDGSIEIVIVNDGSKDNTLKIANQYKNNYPDIVKVVDQENKGHGGAINSGLENSVGLYIKVVDSDDWVDLDSFKAILNKLEDFSKMSNPVDMLVSNFVYEKEGVRLKKSVNYCNVLPQNKILTWNDIKLFKKGQYMLMHALIYRRELLIQSNFKLPEHTFYVDNLFAFYPLNYVKSFYYINVNFYRYYIGREDQSVNEKVMISRIDQQLRVNQLMLDHMLNAEFLNKKMKRYMRHYLEIIMTVSSILLIKSRQKELLSEKKRLWGLVKDGDKSLYLRLRFGLLGILTNLPGEIGRTISIGLYKVSQQVVGFN